MNIKCVVACNGGYGPQFAWFAVECTQDEYDNGDHYDMAIELAKDRRLDGPFVVFDENDGPAWLFKNTFRSM